MESEADGRSRAPKGAVRPLKEVSLNLGDRECPLSAVNNRKLLLINLKINGSECQSILSFEEMSEMLSIFYLPQNSGRNAAGIRPVISTQ